MAGGRRRKQGRRKSCVVLGEVDPLGGRWPSRQRKNPGQIRICVFVQVPNSHSTWRDYLCEKAEQNKYTNRFGHFVAFMCVSVQKKRLFGLSGQNRYAKEQRRTKKPSHRDLYICISVYRSKEITALGIVYTQRKNFGLFGLFRHLKFFFCIFLRRLSRGKTKLPTFRTFPSYGL